MSDYDYGWASRNRWNAKWHKVESEIEDQVVTNCGRWMDRYDASRRELIRVPTDEGIDTDEFCETCI